MTILMLSTFAADCPRLYVRGSQQLKGLFDSRYREKAQFSLGHNAFAILPVLITPMITPPMRRTRLRVRVDDY